MVVQIDNFKKNITFLKELPIKMEQMQLSFDKYSTAFEEV